MIALLETIAFVDLSMLLETPKGEALEEDVKNLALLRTDGTKRGCPE